MVRSFFLDAVGGGLIAFIAAQLGLAIATAADGLRNKVRQTMGSDRWGDKLLLLDVIIFFLIGLWFVLLWVKPDLIAVSDGGDPLKNAPEYIERRPKCS